MVQGLVVMWAVIWVCAMLFLLLGFLLSLVSVAFIYLLVDIARNIRALRLKHGN